MVLHWRFITVYGGEFGLIESITQWVDSRVTVPASGRKNCACWRVQFGGQFASGFFFKFH